MYDQDSSGEISPDEMVEIFSLMYAVQVGGSSWQTNICPKSSPRAAQKEMERLKPRRFLLR